MESSGILVLLVLLVTAAGVITGVAIYNHKRREETESTVTERTQPQGAEKVQPEGAEEAGAEVNRGHREPNERGGKPRGSTRGDKNNRTQGIQPRRLNPEIICWKRERQWVAAAEVPEELLGKPGLTVLQNGSSLSQDESEEAWWQLEQPVGEVVVRWNEDEAIQEAKIKLGRDDYLLFKLSGQTLNLGRRVKLPSSGSYLVIVPTTWKRDEALAGPPPVTPEPTSLPGYVAHFFDLERGSDQKIAFRLPNGSLCVIESKTRRFELVGSRLEDANEHMGPLFGAAPPRIRALDAQAWQEVGTIVIGEEGSGRGKWRMSFDPDPDRTEQDLPPEVADRKGGRYFLRFYNNDDDLIESMDFRFLSVLREIRLPPLLHLPSGDGHKPICVEFLHEPGCIVKPVSSLANIQVERQDDKTILTVPPDPACDESRWLVGPDGGPHLEVTINVERIWWAVGEESSPPSEWQDRPVTLSREDFKATSSKALWLRLPKRRWVDKVEVGFGAHKARQFPVKVSQKTIAIPLRDFGDAQELSNVGTVSLYACTTLVANVIVKARCTFCDFSSSQEEDLISHIESSHLDKLFPPLTYEEMCVVDPSLPPKIYKCSYCDLYVPSTDIRNPVSRICNHIEKECAKVPRGQGPPRISFRAIQDVDEIRQNVIKSLPRIHKCSLCGERLTEASSRARMQHLVERHTERLISLQ